MAMSGVKVDQSCVDVFNKQKMGKKLISTVCYKLTDDLKMIEVDHIVAKNGERVDKDYDDSHQEEKTPEELWDIFRANVPNEECRYYTYDCKYGTKAGTTNEKLCFIKWAPETAKIKSKMLIASSKETIKKSLVGIGFECQAADLSDLDDYQSFASRVSQAK